MAAASSTSTVDYAAIRNVLSGYCIALDNRDWALLETVFSPDLEAHYPFADKPFHRMSDLVAVIQGRLKHVKTQHALTTQTVDIAADGASASARTYFTAAHFGQGRWAGKLLTVWGQYFDELERRPDPSSQTGQAAWLIVKRTVTFMGRTGEEGVLAGEDA